MNDIAEGKTMYDSIEKLGNAIIQHGKSNNRIYVIKIEPAESQEIIPKLDLLAKEESYSKIFAKIQVNILPQFIQNGYVVEAYIPRFYKGETDCVMVSKFFDRNRKKPSREQLDAFFELLASTRKKRHRKTLADFQIRRLTKADAVRISEIHKKVFETYPFPVFEPKYINKTMEDNTARYYGVFDGTNLIAVSTAETDVDNKNSEMTDFAVLPDYRGKKLAYYLLVYMEKEMKATGFKTAYTIARLAEYGMNKTFIKAGYKYSGTLVNNTNIGGKIESMNIFYKHL